MSELSMERRCSCAEAQVLSAEACMLLSKGPNFGRFIHFLHSAPKFFIYGGKTAGGLPRFPAGRRQGRTGSEFQIKYELQKTDNEQLTRNTSKARFKMVRTFHRGHAR